MDLKDIDPRFLDEYKQFDGRHVACGPCKNATLKMNISTCKTNSNGSPSPNCKEDGTITSSNGKTVIYPNNVSTENIKTFFCFQ